MFIGIWTIAIPILKRRKQMLKEFKTFQRTHQESAAELGSQWGNLASVSLL
jgi:hypothetical protein